MISWGQFSSGQVSEVDHFHPNPPPPPPPQFRPYEFVVQRVSRAMAKVMKSPVQASLHVFSKTFCPKLDFFYCIYRFLSAGDCHHGNRLVSVVFKLCKRIISPIDMTSFYKTTHDKIHEYYSVF